MTFDLFSSNSMKGIDKIFRKMPYTRFPSHAGEGLGVGSVIIKNIERY